MAEARQQGVLSVCADTIAGSGFALDEPTRRERLLCAASELRTAADLGPLAALLDEAAVRWVVVKGPVLAKAYRRPNVRSYQDLDVLVHPLDLPRVLDLLEASGADLLDRNWELIAASGRGEIGWRLPHGSFLDLHWHLVNRADIRARLGQRPPEVLERRIRTTLAGVAAWSMEPVDVVLHTAQHACLSGGHSVKWLLDVQQAVRWAAPEPSVLQARARATNLELLLGIAVDRAARYVDPHLRTWGAALSTGGPYRRFARAVSRNCPPTAARDHYSGRAAFSSIRENSLSSTQALLASVHHNASQGKSRRTTVATAEPLRRERGGHAERDTWLALAARFG